MNTGSQFKSAFVRQLGREFAHDAYKDATNYTEKVREVSEEFVTKFVSNDYAWVVLATIAGFFFPLAMLVPMVFGFIRIFGNKIKGHRKGLVDIYKADGRCRGGNRYCGKTEQWITEYRRKEECTDEQVEDARIYGIGEVCYGVVVMVGLLLLWGLAL